MDKKIGKIIESRDIVDLMNIIGKCVVAGNIRRVAEIALGEANDKDFIDLKNY
jgi:ribonucleoside-triphosphate reductase (thioredoxin)